jgi:hypothetical protein
MRIEERNWLARRSVRLHRCTRLTILLLLTLVLMTATAFQLEAQASSKIVAIEAGFGHTVGLKQDGSVVGVGSNSYGQLDIRSWTNIIQVAAGALHTVGLKADGTVVATGRNDDGEINVGGWTDIVQVAAGFYHTVGLRRDGRVVAVGRNTYDQLNVSDWTGIVQVAAGLADTVGLKIDGTTVAAGWTVNALGINDWTDIVQVAAGSNYTVGLKQDGSVVGKGMNRLGEVDVAGWTDIIQVAATGHTIGLKVDGTVMATGSNTYGQLDVTGWVDIIQVAAGSYHTVGLKVDGTVVAVGYNGYGQLAVDEWNVRSNAPPAFEPVGNRQVKEGELLQFVVTATDPEGDAVAYGVTGLPRGATFDTATGSFVWQPDFTQAGSYTITFSATDNGIPSMKTEMQVLITVGDVLTPSEQISALVTTVMGLGLEKETVNSYLANLKKVENFMKGNQHNPAINQLTATINKVRQDMVRGKISTSQGQALIDRANELLRMLMPS